MVNGTQEMKKTGSTELDMSNFSNNDFSHTIMLDLDSTLIHTTFISENQLNEIKNSPQYDSLKHRVRILKIIDINDNDIIGRGVITTAIVILRPHLKEFIEFISSYFDDIRIWSAGHKRYVRGIESLIFAPENELYINKPIKVLTRLDCNEITDRSVLKDLASKGLNLSSTLIVDDNSTTFVNNPNNAIHIPAYNAKPTKDDINKDDKCLLNLIEWIKKNNVNKCLDVRKLDKSHIFK